MSTVKTYEEWYEGNKEHLTVLTHEGKLRAAFNAGKSSGVDLGIRYTDPGLVAKEKKDNPY